VGEDSEVAKTLKKRVSMGQNETVNRRSSADGKPKREGEGVGNLRNRMSKPLPQTRITLQHKGRNHRGKEEEKSKKEDAC